MVILVFGTAWKILLVYINGYSDAIQILVPFQKIIRRYIKNIRNLH